MTVVVSIGGTKVYFGKPCPVHGPAATRYFSSNGCVECGIEASRRKAGERKVGKRLASQLESTTDPEGKAQVRAMIRKITRRKHYQENRDRIIARKLERRKALEAGGDKLRPGRPQTDR